MRAMGPSRFEGPGPGTYLLVETNVPFGYLKAGGPDVHDCRRRDEGVHRRQPAGRRAQYPQGRRVRRDRSSGACFIVYTDAGNGVRATWWLSACDSHPVRTTASSPSPWLPATTCWWKASLRWLRPQPKTCRLASAPARRRISPLSTFLAVCWSCTRPIATAIRYRMCACRLRRSWWWAGR